MGDLEKGATPPDQTGANRAPRGKGASGGSARDLWDPRAINQYWLDAMSQALDVWMRSHAFLRLMRQGLEMATAFPRGQDLAARNLATAEKSDLAAKPNTEDPAPAATGPAAPMTFPAAPIATSVAAGPPLPVRAEPPSLSKAKRKIQAKGSKSP